MSALPRPVPADPGFRYHVELIDGREVEKPTPKKLHTWIQVFLIMALGKSLPEAYEPLSELDVQTGEFTADGRREYICPDVQVAAKTAKYEDGMLAEPPVLGVEILSPGQSITELFVRAHRLVKLGALNVWVIWPEQRRAWELGPSRIDEVTGKLTMRLPSETEPADMEILLPEMWKVLDRPE